RRPGRAAAPGRRDPRHTGPRARGHHHATAGSGAFRRRAGRDARARRACPSARAQQPDRGQTVRAGARSQELGRAHLPEALRALTERWSRDQGMSAQMEVTGVREPLSPAIEVSLFRVTQESLTNVAKHAAASRVGVTLSYTGNEVLLDVRDDGRGFPTRPSARFGLMSMRQRI